MGRAGVRAAREGDDAGWGFLMHRSILILLVAVQALALASWVAVCAHRVYAEAAEMRTESRTAIRESDRILVAVLAALRRADPCAQSKHANVSLPAQHTTHTSSEDTCTVGTTATAA